AGGRPRKHRAPPQPAEGPPSQGPKPAAVPAAETPPVPCVGPLGARCVPAPRASAKSRPSMAKMSDRGTRSDRSEAASDVTTMPPFGPDRREDGRTGKESEGGWAKDDERRREHNDNFGRRQHHDWWRHRSAEERANRRGCDCRRRRSCDNGWRDACDGWRANIRNSRDNRRWCRVDGRGHNDQRWGDDNTDRGTDQEATPGP